MCATRRRKVATRETTVRRSFASAGRGRAERVASIAFEGLVYATLFTSALLFGAVETWAEAIVAVLVTAMAVCWVIATVPKGLSVPGARRLQWLVLAFVGLAAAQLVPLPIKVMNIVSPQTAYWHQASLDARSESGAAQVAAVPISLTPSASANELRRLILIAAVFLMVSTARWSRRTIERFLTAVGVFGGALALLAIAQSVSGTDRLYWVRETDGAFFGPLANANNYCACLNLCAGAALASLLIRVDRDRRQGRPSWSSAGTVVLIVAVALIVVSVLASRSRGGIVMMVVGAGLAGVLLASRGRTELQFKWLLIVGLAAAVGIAWLGWSPVEGELETLDRELGEQGARLRLWRDCLAPVRDHWLLGTGLGSFEHIIPIYRTYPVNVRNTHAESNIVQLGVEAGGVGVLLGVGFIVSVALAWRQIWRHHHNATTTFLLIGLAYALVTNVLHASIDVGMLISSNALLFAVFCAIVPATATSRTPEASESPPLVRKGFRQQRSHGEPRLVLRAGLIALILVTSTGLGRSYARTLRSEWYWGQAHRLLAVGDEPDGTLSDVRAERVLALVQQCVRTSPHDPTLRYELASMLWVRWNDRLASNGAPLPDMVGTNRKAHDALDTIAEHLRQVCLSSPVLSFAHTTLAAVRQAMGQSASALRLARHGMRLFPSDGWHALAAAQIAIAQGELEPAREWLRRTLTLRPAYLDDVLDIAISDPALAEAIVEIIPSNGGLLLSRAAELIGLVAEQEEDATLVRQHEVLLQAAIAALQRDRRLATDAKLRFRLADDYASAGSPTAAAEQLRKGLELSPGDTPYRVKYAEILAELGQVERAEKEVRRALRSRPGNARGRRLLKKLVRIRNAAQTTRDEPPNVSA